MSRIKIIALFLISGVVFGTTYYACQGMTSKQIKDLMLASENGCGSEANCGCSTEVNNIVDGRNYSLAYLQGHSGGNPENVFLNGGSENIPVTCNTGIYLATNDTRWFEDYFTVQKRSDVGFMNTEIFSPGYAQQTLGFALTVLNHAIQKGHTQLEQAAAAWARAYWAYLSLATVQQNTLDFEYSMRNGWVRGPEKSKGYGVSTVGTRSYPTQQRGIGTHHVFLALALDLPTRDIGKLNPVGVHGGLRAFLVKTGFHGNADNKFNITQRSLTPREVGLSETDRTKLVEFINSNGTQNYDYVLDMIRPYPLFCKITFLRTTGGIITWFGDSQSESTNCTPIKGGAYSAVSLVNGHGKILLRVSRDNNPTLARVWRNGNRICSSADLPTECIDIPPGDTIYELTVGRNGPVCVTGTCTSGQGGGSQPPPPPSSTPTPTPPPPQPTSTPPPSIDNCSSPNTLCLMNNRYHLAATYRNQFNNTSGVASAITNTDISGFFHFGDANNIELITKVLNFSGTVKVFYGQLTNLQFTLFVRDSQTGVTRSYQNTPGDCGGIDNNAFTASITIPKNEIYAGHKFTPLRSPANNCRPDSNTLCLQGGRIRISATWRNQYNNTSGTATVRPLTQVTGGLYFSDGANLELLVKAVDFGNHYLVMYGTLSNLEYNLTITDTVNGNTRTYHNPAGNYCGGIDGATFTK